MLPLWHLYILSFFLVQIYAIQRGNATQYGVLWHFVAVTIGVINAVLIQNPNWEILVLNSSYNSVSGQTTYSLSTLYYTPSTLVQNAIFYFQLLLIFAGLLNMFVQAWRRFHNR